MKKRQLTLVSAFVIGMLAAAVGVFGFDGPPSVSAQTTSNSAATGAPTISGTAQVGQTLRVSTSGIADADGLSAVSFSYQWLAADADIAGATESSYTLVAANLTKTINVRVSFSDDAGNAETLTSQGVGPVDQRAGGTGEQLTAEFSNVPASHDGSELTFNVTFTPEPSLSYATFRAHAFSVVSGTITKAYRTKDGDEEWAIRVVPDLDSDENPAGQSPSCFRPPPRASSQSAVCTSDNVPLSNRTEVTIPVSTDGPDRPGQPQGVTATPGPDIGEITLSWTAAPVDSDPEAAVRGYRVRYNCGGETRTARLGPNSRSFKIVGIDRSTTCLLNVAARNDGGYGPVAWAGSDSAYHPPMNPPEAPASITVTPDDDSEGTRVSWTAPAKGDAPHELPDQLLGYRRGAVPIRRPQQHHRSRSGHRRGARQPQDRRGAWPPGRCRLRGPGVWGPWAVGWHESATRRGWTK